MKGGRESTRPPPLRAPGKGNKKRRKSDLAGAARQSYNDKELCKFVFCPLELDKLCEASSICFCLPERDETERQGA